MDSLVEIFLERAGNEIMAAESLKKLSEENETKEEFSLPQDTVYVALVLIGISYLLARRNSKLKFDKDGRVIYD